MTEFEALQEQVKSLSENDYSAFRDWFIEFENEQWDQQIHDDFQSGKFNTLIQNAKSEYNQGKAQEL